MTVKLITLVADANLPGLSHFLAERAEGFPGLLRLVFNTVLPTEVRPTAAPERWDAVVEAWFETDAALEAWKAATPHEGRFVHLVVEQKLIHDSGTRPLPAKVMVLFRRREDLTRAQAQAHWLGQHVEIGLIQHNATDFLRLYLQNHVSVDHPTDRQGYDYDGMPEFWLDQDALSNVGPDSDVMRAIAKDEENFIHPGSTVTLLVQEEELFCRPESGTGWDAGALGQDTRYLAANRRVS